MRLKISGWLLVWISSACFGQNLIPDSSFSFNNSVGATMKSNYWYSPQPNFKTFTGVVDSNFTNSQFDNFFLWWALREGRTDSCKRCDSTEYKREINRFKGHKDYYLFRPLDFPSNHSRAYFSDVLGCELTSPLIRDSIYEIKLLVLPNDFLAIPSIQVYLSHEKLQNVDKIKNESRLDLYKADSSMLINPVVSLIKNGYLMTETHASGWEIKFADKWICISGTYKANGDERYFYIGNINKFEYVNYEFNSRPFSMFRRFQLVEQRDDDRPYQDYPGNHCDFFIDDVSVRKITTPGK